MAAWTELFRFSVPVGETLLRGTVMFLAIYAIARVVGKREAGAHSLTDLLVVVLVAEAAAPGLAGESKGLLDSLLLIVTIFAWSVAIDALAYRWPALAPLLKSRPVPLIRDGQLNQRALRREFMQHEELMAELRMHGVTDVKDVARAYLEPSGMISIIRADRAEPDQPAKPPVVG
ncbi:DUF421 domain-containing protein [Cystobacter ferrugineus]|uniref:YetF C-terminal domain-containing protein n=1 Tax=Cystobacter ferrugineus TaxID=83449 RepID=A0A1L9AYN0_9BACT|nr:YetF domain-containing protein [Cystobacter ferrugineus]OJH35121.1 hypothetical protein BON30_39310 [Cystobacter ferrugineus]